MISNFSGETPSHGAYLKNKQIYLKLAGLSFAGLLFLPLLLGGAFFKAFIKQTPLYYGLIYVSLLSFALGVAQPHLGVFVGALFIMVFAHSVGESRGLSFLHVSAASLGLGVVVWAAGTQVLFLILNQNWSSQSLLLAEFLQSQLVKAAGNNIGVTAEQIQMQLPGSLLSLFILFLGFSVGLERKAHAIFRIPFERYVGQLRPLDFRVPDFLLWVALFGILFSIFDEIQWLQVLGENIITVSLAVYFFQGLAILEVFLVFLRVHPFLKFFTYFTLVGQLLLVISALGFIDFWLDLRKKMRNSLQRT